MCNVLIKFQLNCSFSPPPAIICERRTTLTSHLSNYYCFHPTFSLNWDKMQKSIYSSNGLTYKLLINWFCYRFVLHSIVGCVFCWRYFDWYFQLLYTIAINTFIMILNVFHATKHPHLVRTSKNLFVFTNQMDFTPFLVTLKE